MFKPSPNLRLVDKAAQMDGVEFVLAVKFGSVPFR